MVSWTLRICAIVFALMMFIGSWNGFLENQAFKEQGQKVPTEPLGKYTETITAKKKLFIKTGESKVHSAEIIFTTLDKQRINVNKNIPDEVFAHYLAGDKVYIEYLPQTPTTTRFDGESASPVLSALFGIAVLIGTVLFWRKM